jgi:hypothetical protein
MPYVNVPKDLTRVKTKVALGLTKRQLVCFSAAAVSGIPVYFLAKGLVGNTAAVLLMIIAMLPFFFFSMYERDGLSAEKVLANILRHRLMVPARPYKTENLYLYLKKEGTPIASKDKTAKGARKAPAHKPAHPGSKQGRS